MMFGKFSPIRDADVKSKMKLLWSPMPPYLVRRHAFTQTTPAVAKIASIGLEPPSNVAGR